MIEIIKDKGPWDSLLKKSETYDFYHTFEYHRISKKPDEQPILFKYSEGEKFIAIPLLLRNIPNSSYKDCTSVYGYGGPVLRNIDEDFDNTSFIAEFQELLIENKIVTIFSRLNPFVPKQPLCLNGLGEIGSLSKVVNIDVTENLEVQRTMYSKRLRTHINKARRECYIKDAGTKEEVMEFIALYYKNMERVNATKEYFFSEQYFFELFNAKDFNTRIILAIEKETDKIIAGAMFINTENIVQYHLSGCDANYLHLYPVKMLIDEMRILATEEGFSYFNLGGGVGNKKDSLFDFKAGYSKDFKPFRVWKFIVDQKTYDMLVSKKQEMDCTRFDKQCTLFFPCYRCNI